MKKLTKLDFIIKSKIVHNDKYNYSKTVYNGALNKVIITCPIHGDFEQEASSHMRGCGCKKCADIGAPKIKNFIERANLKFNSKFNYEKSIINKSNDEIIIICPIHGEFIQTPSRHLQSKHGCPECAKRMSAKQISLTEEEFIERSIIVHGSKYDYSKVKYINRRSPIKIICKIHGEFTTTPEIHLKGCDCPNCAVTGWDKTSWINLCKNNKNSKPSVYIIKCWNNDELFYKIGRTMRSIYDRFARPTIMPYKYEIINQIFDTSENIFNLEVKLHRLNYVFKYKPRLKFAGSTECFTKFKIDEI